MMLSFFVSSWMIIHLGIKPVRGGSPPRDNIVVRMIVGIRGSLFHIWDRESVVVVEVRISSINTVSVIKT